MDNLSILEQIISNQKEEEVAKLNAVEIVKNLFNELSDRERDILTRRFGLHGRGQETLENVGSSHGLTRERIRQIESASVKKLAKLNNLSKHIETLKKVIEQLLYEHGGLMERDYLLDSLVHFSMNGDSLKNEEREKVREVHKSHLDFLISKLLYQEFEEVSSSKKFKKSFKIKYQDINHLEEILEELLLKVKETKNIFNTSDLIKLVLDLDSYGKHKEKIDREYTIDISKVLKSDLFEEDPELINNNKALYSILKAASEIEQNKFGHWGIYNWREVKPKTINDKIYLVLKNQGKPMHFVDIAKRINEISFDKKKANSATVHNELILDNKYVLIGRGIYGLKEWGYKEGTVLDVIKEILSISEEPLSKEEIIKKVLEKRLVKETTIVLALMNRDIFDKIDNKYLLKAQEA